MPSVQGSTGIFEKVFELSRNFSNLPESLKEFQNIQESLR